MNTEPLDLDRLLFAPEALEKLKIKYPEIQDDLENLKNNPNCECRNDVKNFLNEKSEAGDSEYLSQLAIESAPILGAGGTATLYPFDENGNGVHYFDNPDLFKIHRVEKTPEAWEEFVKTTRKKLIFSQFTVVDKGDHLEVYFM